MRLVFRTLLAALCLVTPALAQQKKVITGTPNSGQGDSPFTAFNKLNDNDTDLYRRFNTLNSAVPQLGPDGRIRVPAGPTLGTYQNGQFTSQPYNIQLQGPGSTGAVDGMTVTPAGGSENRSLSGWLGDLSGALAYVPTLSAKLTLAKWLDVPARPQWWGAKCDGTTVDTTALQSAVSGSATAGLRLRVTGICVTGTLNAASSTKVEASLSGGLKLIGPTGPIFLIAAGADDVAIDGLSLDATSIGTASGDSATSSIFQTPGAAGGRVVIRNNRFKFLAPYPANNHAVMLNGAISFVENNFVEGTGGDALNFNGGYNEVYGNYVGISGDGCVAFNNNAHGVVSGNVLVQCTLGFGVGSFTGSDAAGPPQSIVFSNNIVESADYGVNMGWFGVANTEGPSNWTVSNNVFRGTKSVAINYDGRSLGWVANGTISGNTITGTGAPTFTGPQDSATTPADIRLANASGVTITGNRLSAPRASVTKRAVYLISSRDVTATGNSINGSLDVNTNGSTTSANVNRYDFVFDLIEAQGANISGNTARFGGTFARLDLITAGGAYDTIVNGNQALDMNVQGVNLQKNGSGFSVTDNIIRSAGWGVYLPSVASDFMVSTNVISSATGQAIAAPSGVGAFANWQIRNNATTGSQPNTDGEIVLTGTTDANGNAVIPHGLGAAPRKVLSFTAFVRGNSGEAINLSGSGASLSANAVDGTNVYVSVGTTYASRPIRVKLTYTSNVDANWP